MEVAAIPTCCLDSDRDVVFVEARNFHTENEEHLIAIVINNTHSTVDTPFEQSSASTWHYSNAVRRDENVSNRTNHLCRDYD